VSEFYPLLKVNGDMSIENDVVINFLNISYLRSQIVTTTQGNTGESKQ